MIELLAAFPELQKMIPRSDYGDPKALREWLSLAATYDRKGAQKAAYTQAFDTLSRHIAEGDLRDQISALYHDPKIRAEFGAERVEAAWRDPATAREELLNLSSRGKLSAEASRALDLIYSVDAYAMERGAALPPPAVEPIPSGPDAQKQELDRLLDKSARGPLTKAEHARVDELYEIRLARERTAATAPTAARPSGSDEYQRLIELSISGKISPEQNSRLDALSEQRAVEQGLVDPADLPGNFTEGVSDGGSNEEP